MTMVTALVTLLVFALRPTLPQLTKSGKLCCKCSTYCGTRCRHSNLLSHAVWHTKLHGFAWVCDVTSELYCMRLFMHLRVIVLVRSDVNKFFGEQARVDGVGRAWDGQ